MGKKLGYEAKFGVEFEWLVQETPESLQEKGFRGMTPITPGMFGYSLLRPAQNELFLMTLCFNSMHLASCRGLHTETGPGFSSRNHCTRSCNLCGSSRLVQNGNQTIGISPRDHAPTFMAKWNAVTWLLGTPPSESVQGWRPVFHDSNAPHRCLTFLNHTSPDNYNYSPIFLLLAPTVNKLQATRRRHVGAHKGKLGS